MVPPFNDLPVFQDNDFICISDGGKAVGYDKTCPVFHELVYPFLNDDFRSCIYGTGRLVQNQNGWPGYCSPGDIQ